MKRVLLCLLMILSAGIARSQVIISGNLSTTASDTVKKKILDHSNVIAVYRYKYVFNPETPEKTRNGFTELQIGDRYNSFQDLFANRSDSVFDAGIRAGDSPWGLYSKISPYEKKKRFDERILFDKEKEDITVFKDINARIYRYDEKFAVPEWEIVEGDTVIAGYECKKALTRFAGRDYVAWFAPEIDLPYGPYKFHGLPGLILKVSDTKNHHMFTIYRLEKDRQNKSIYIPTRSDVIKSNRDKVRKIYKNSREEPVKSFEAVSSVKLSEDAHKKDKPLSYNPIELE